MPDTDCEPGTSEWLAKGNPEEIPHKSNAHCHEGATQGLSLWVGLCVCPTSYTLFLLLMTLCFTTVCLCGDSFLHSGRCGPLSLTAGLYQAGIRCFHCRDTAHIRLGTQDALQAFAGQGHLRSWPPLPVWCPGHLTSLSPCVPTLRCICGFSYPSNFISPLFYFLCTHLFRFFLSWTNGCSLVIHSNIVLFFLYTL